MKKEEFDKLLLDLRKENGHGFTKTLREYSDELYIHTIKEYMKSFSMLDIKDNLVLILPLMGKIIGIIQRIIRRKSMSDGLQVNLDYLISGTMIIKNLTYQMVK